MPTSRRSVLAAACGMASTTISAAPQPGPRTATARSVPDLIERSEASNAALMRGDIERYRALVSFSDDFTLMSPFGGTPTRARNLTPDRIDAMGRFFRNGSLRQELVQAYGSTDMVVLALIEHAHVEVGGLPAQDWSLRVTLVYCREGDAWQLAHRHADPLVAEISLERSAALARGER
ncbi:MAG TPA: nuclear transport factor 2 family protein [Rubrivivax sp.]|nr:nuclear transport factor 2 family protein [Rubrivivax sp.]